MKKYFKIYFFCLAFFVFVVAMIRSIKMGITCDEALTYLLFITQKWTLNTDLIANNHVLNTLLILLLTNITKVSFNVFIMRIPNLVFYLMYIYYVYKLSSLYENKAVVATLFLLNYGVNEFSSLARGYGIASALILSGVYYYKLYLRDNKIKNLKISIFQFLMASLANTTNLIIVGCFMLDAIIRMVKKKKIKEFIINQKKYIICSALFFILLFAYHIYISFGDRFLSSSMCHKDLFSCLVYSSINYYGSSFISKIVVEVVILFSIILFIYHYKNIKFEDDNLFYITLVIYAILIICKIIFPFEIPAGRTLIPFISIYILSIIDFMNFFQHKTIIKFFNIGIFCLCIFSFFKNLNMNYVREWKDDYNLNQLIKEKYKNREIIRLNEVPKVSYHTLIFYYKKYKKEYFYKLMNDEDYYKLINYSG